MKKLLPLIISSTLTFNVLASTGEPKYDCTAEEVASYIKINTVSLSMPSSISNPDDAVQAIIDTRQKKAEKNGESDEESCFTLWGDFPELEPIDWSKFQLPDFDFSKFTSLIDVVMKKIEDEFDSLMEKLEEEMNKGICERLEEVDWAGLGDEAAEYFEGKIDDKYGVDLGDADWWEGPLKKELNGEMKNLGDYVFDPEELEEDINSETRRKIKQKDKEFWDEI